MKKHRPIRQRSWYFRNCVSQDIHAGICLHQDVLLQAAKQALLEITEFTREKDMLVFVGVPLVVDAKLYNVAAALCRGEILGLTTKTFLPNYGEFYEMRQFTAGPDVREKSCLTAKKCRLVRGFCFRHPLWKS